MPRYIDAEKLEKDGWSASRTYQQDAKTKVYEAKKMTDFPTANVRENVHAKFVSEIIKKSDWKGRMQSYYQPNSCSNCHTALTGKENFCPECGAEMEGEDDE